MSEKAMTTTTDRIRAAEKQLARAQNALEKAERGLRAAEKVSETVDEARSHPLRTTLVGVAAVGLVLLGVIKFRAGGR